MSDEELAEETRLEQDREKERIRWLQVHLNVIIYITVTYFIRTVFN